MELLANLLHHPLVFIRGRVKIISDVEFGKPCLVLRLVAREFVILDLGDGASARQANQTVAPGEIQVFAIEQNGWTGRANVNG